jgi:uncharacterized protein YjbK
MEQNLEIEFKNLLLKEEFDLLKRFFNINDSDFFTQENHYFDTPVFALKEKGCALRLREKESSFELTLKQPHKDGLLETTELLSAAQKEAMLRSGKINHPAMTEVINQLGVSAESITYFGSLKTNRAQTVYRDGLIVLDHSLYLNKEDYELEYEVSNRETGQKVFTGLLQDLRIPLRETENKIKRFYRVKKESY